ncbi:hypothetical protein DOTSEDRAFT_170752 [Dothistroma septosporum NZE10]|uniref:NAD(P)-binding protein n=1 Tax=Dothistroma septosporum (strain NZE10 / CBS 128990) TaxID=675120 RepID=N1PSJ0_DOTSN|nr:hypothetical protein DOTSEDRAFT_170752 [Dothistroma septosporum NZE10]
MTSSKNTVTLISGANRGLGKGLLELFLAEPNHTVIAANRDPHHASSKALLDLPTGKGSKLITVKIDASVPEDAASAIAEIKKQGIDYLDVVIANAGVSYTFPFVKDLKIEDLQGHIEPNVYGVISLYQATRELLDKGTDPKWMTMGSSAGWLENQHPVPNSAYAPTKTMVHWLTKRINGEEERICAFVQDPGWVQTGMGNFGARAWGPGEAPLGVEESVTGMKKVIEAARKDTHGGKMFGIDGKQQAW